MGNTIQPTGPIVTGRNTPCGSPMARDRKRPAVHRADDDRRAVTTFPSNNVSFPAGIADADGALWFTNRGLSIGRMSTGGAFTWFDGLNDTIDITKGPDDALWFTNGGTTARGRSAGSPRTGR